MNPKLPVAESPVGPWLDRLIAFTFVAAATAVVFVLSKVPPDPRGHGTHERLGMEACGWPSAYGVPCPTCGVTTAATHLVHLQPLEALAVQPFGAILAGVGLWLALLAAISLLRRQAFMARLMFLPYGRMTLGGMVLLLASWAYRYWTWDD